MLSVHLYRYSQYKAKILQDNRTITVDKKNQQQTYQGPQESKGKDKFTAEEEVIMLPVEDVLRISSKSETVTGIEADIKSQTTPVYAESENCCDRCYAGLLSCCRKTRDCCCYFCREENKVGPLVLNKTTIFVDEDPNRSTNFVEEHLPIPEENEGYCTRCCNKFRCWCCRKKKLVDLIRRTKTVAEREAQRVITITIECIPYSNLDAASNPHLLNSEQKIALYRDQFKTNTLQFYLVNSTEFDPKKFEPKRQQAEILCLTVMRLKAMRNHYPSENELIEILQPSSKRTFGDEFNEPVLQLPFNSATKRRDPQIQELPQPAPLPMIQQKRPTTSEYHGEMEKKVIEEDLDIDEDDS